MATLNTVRNFRWRRLAIAPPAILCLLLGAPLSAQGQAPGTPEGDGARWQPWLGCWEMLRDTAHDEGRPAGAALPRGTLGRHAEGHARLCLSRGDGGVRVRTETEGQPATEETLVADGSRRSIDDRACAGWQQVELSADGQRLYGRAELTCGGGPVQAVSHLATILNDTWIDVQGITSGGREGVRVRRYRRVGAERIARVVPGRAFDVNAVKEAAARVDAVVLQAALAETESRFRLDGRTLLDLQAAGVPGDITDLMVALSYPHRFRVDRARAASGGGYGFDEWSDYYLWGYAPFASSFWGWGSWYGDPGVIILDPGGGGGGGTPDDGRGRVVNNRGYTRIETIETARRSDRGTASSGSTTSTSSAGSTSGSSSGSSSGGVSSQGYSSGGSDSGGRTAQPRN